MVSRAMPRRSLDPGSSRTDLRHIYNGQRERPWWAHVIRAGECAEMFERLISDRAARDRKAIAVATQFDNYSYADMEADIRRCVARLRPLGLKPGSRAILQVSDLYTHWLLTFALEALGVVSIGLNYLYPVDATIVTFLRADFVFADRPLQPGVSVRSQLTGRDWMKITR